MARPLRIERVGGWYRVTGRGNERRSIYRDDTDSTGGETWFGGLGGTGVG